MSKICRLTVNEMKLLLRRCSILCALLLLGSTQAGWSQTRVSPPVQKIEVQHIGPPAVSDELVRANIRIKVGEPFSGRSVDSDIINLYSTGYFYTVRVVDDIKDGGLVLTYVVQGKPVLTTVEFSGNKKYSNKKLLKKVTSKTGEPLDEKRLFTDAQEIQKMYQKAGYQKTEVKYVLNIDENLGRGTATFEVKEAPKVKIKDVVFEGADEFTQRKLRKVLKTRRNWMFSWLTGSGKLKDEQFDEDKQKLKDFYFNEGYIDFDLKSVEFTYPNEKRMIIHMNVYEGQQYKVGNVKFEGNKLFTTNQLSERLKMNVGEVFTPKGLSTDTDAVSMYYESRGYLSFNNEGNTGVRAVRNANIEQGTMDLTYRIQEGDKSFVEKIEIQGNIKTKDKVLRRELAIYPGEVFNMARVYTSTNRLSGLNYFSKVNAKVEPTEVPNRKNLVIGVEEKSTGNFQVGAGFSSVENLVGYAEVTQGNFDLFNPPYFTGGGQKIRLRAQVGTRQQDYQINFVEPFFLGKELAFGVDLYHRELNYYSDIYDQTQTGVRLSLTKRLPYNFEVGVSYTLENIGIEFEDEVKAQTPVAGGVPGRNGSPVQPTPASVSQELLDEEGDRLVSKVGTTIAYDTRGAGFLPSSGQRTELMGEVSGGPFAGDTDVYKMELRTAWYFPGFFEGHILEIVGRTGVVDTYGDSTRVPLFDRWFLGGLYSLRGYRYRDIGPKDINGEPVGGSTYWFGTAEYSVPIIERLRFAMFYDIGNVYRDAYSFDTTNPEDPFYSDNWGLGVRLNIPNLGPLRLDYAFPLTHDSTVGGGGRFQFGVGFTRDF